MIVLLSAATDTSVGRLTGTLVDKAGWKLRSAQVTLKHTGEKKMFTAKRTDLHGGFDLTNLPPGDYEVCFAAQGYQRTCRSHLGIKPGDNPMGTIIVDVDSGSGIVIQSPAQ